MERVNIVIFLVMNLFVLISRADGKNQGRKILLDEVDRRLQLLNKPAVKSIKTDYGDIIDCIDIYKQPAFDHPALKNHIIQMTPSFEISTEKSKTTKTLSSSSLSQPRVFQTWQKYGRCPDGTIPIRRITREDLLRADSLEEFGKKHRHVSHHLTKDSTFAKHTPFSSSNNSYGQYQANTLENRSYARLFSSGFNHIGASAAINVWNPSVEKNNEDYTTAQIWLQAAPPGEDFESVEFGWTVNPKLYGHNATTYFAYWTRNGYKSTGCFDLTCPGFVQTNPKACFGGPIRPLSVVGGAQYDIPIGIFKDPIGNWWVREEVDGVQTVWGYWPAELFAYLNHGASFTAWGGEVYSPKVKKTPHTTTAMGSGAFAAAKWGAACFVRNIRIVDDSIQLKYPPHIAIQAEENSCYTAENFLDSVVNEPVFYFGGPGRNPRCA